MYDQDNDGGLRWWSEIGIFLEEGTPRPEEIPAKRSGDQQSNKQGVEEVVEVI